MSPSSLLGWQLSQLSAWFFLLNQGEYVAATAMETLASYKSWML